MIRSFYAVPALFCLATALVTAQAPPAEKPAAQQPAAQQPTTAQQPTPDSSTSAANKITYTGCIKPGTTEGTWILENADVAQRAGAASAPSTVGTSGAAKMSFNLDPAATVNLKSHANHKVELVGTLSASKSGAAAAPSAAAGGATAGAAARQERESAPIIITQPQALTTQLPAKHTILFEQLERGEVDHGASLYHGPKMDRSSALI